jgi:hypothetical protein
MVRKLLMILIGFIAICGIAFSAMQEPATVEIDFAAVQYILATGVGGLSVLALVEMLKRMFKLKERVSRVSIRKLITRVLSVVVSAGAVALWQTGTGGFDLVPFSIMTVLVSLGANGIYLAPKPKPN